MTNLPMSSPSTAMRHAVAIGAIPMQRECGDRTQGGLYAECAPRPHGQPMSTYLHDPVLGVDPAALGLSAQGTRLHSFDGVTSHIVDIVGAVHYEEPLDFSHEADSIGVSRRLPNTLDFKQLSAQSLLYLIHPHAFVKNRRAFTSARHTCPTGQHAPGDVHCIGLHSHLAAPRQRRAPDDAQRRDLACGASYAVRPLLGAPVAERSPGLFLTVPITRLVAVDSGSPALNQKRLDLLRQSGLPVALVAF